MHRVVLLTGSNHPSKERLIARAAELLEEHIGAIESRSEVCYSEAWGFSSQEEFANQALLLSSELEPFEVLDRALEVEQILGRDREAEQAEKSLSGEAYASRVIDVDVIFYDDEQMAHPRLELPHPRLQLREFALVPLSQIMGDYVHPKFGQSINAMLQELREKS